MIVNFITEYTGDVPNRQNDTPIAFADNVYRYQVWIDGFTKELNTTLGEINTTAQDVNDNAETAEYAKDAAVGAANFKGAHVSGNAYMQGESVEHGSKVFVSKIDNNTDTTDTANWLELPSLQAYIDLLALKENIADNDAKLALKENITDNDDKLALKENITDNDAKLALKQDKATLLDAIKEVDGAGSGLDADLVQGVTKNLLGIGGDGYAWVDEKANRALETTYTNTNGKPIMLIVSCSNKSSENNYAVVYVDGLLISRHRVYSDGGAGAYHQNSSVIIPNGSTYSVKDNDGAGVSTQLVSWLELK